MQPEATNDVRVAEAHREKFGLRTLLVGLGFAGLALALRLFLDRWLGNVQQLLTLYGCVAASYWFSGWRSAALTSILGWLALNYFVTPPRHQFSYDSAAVASAIGALISCGIIIALAEANRRARRLAHLREREAESHLRRAERLAAIVHSSSDAIIGIDSEGRINSWNRGAELLYGYSAAEAEGQPAGLLAPPDRREKEKHILETVLQGTPVEHYETARRRKDGSLVPVALAVSPVRDSAGNIVGASKIARDITRRKLAEEALQRSEATLRTALEAGQLGVWNWDIRGNRVTWTDRIYAFHGLSRDQFDGTVEGFARLVHPDDLPRVHEALQGALEGTASYRVEFRARRPDGEIRWLVTGAQVFRNEAGEPERMVGVTQDITERLHVQEALRVSETRFRGLMEQAPFSVQLFSPDGKTVQVNRAWEELWGFPFEQLENYNVLEDEQLAAKGVLPFIRRAFAGESLEIPAICYNPAETIAALSQAREPERWVSAVAYPLKRDDGEISEIVMIHQDITIRKKAEDALRASEERLRLLTDNIPALISYIDRELIYRFANATYLEWFDRAPREVIGQHAASILGEEIFQQREPHMLRALRGESCRFEGITHHHKLGPRHCEIVYIPEQTKDGVPGFYVFVHDVHDRKVAEQSLQTALGKLQAHFQNSPLAVVEWDDKLKVLQWSRGAEALFGIPTAETVGKVLTDLPIVFEPDKEKVAAVAGRLLSGLEPFVFSSNRNIARDGRVLHCEWYNTVVGRTERVASILSLVLDVTDRTRVEEALRESEARFRQLADAMPQLVWTSHPDGAVDYYNERIHSFSGVTRDSEGNWRWELMVHPDDVQETARAWRHSVETGGLYSVTHRVRMADGEYRWHLSRALPVRGASGEIVRWFGTATDIDDQKRAEERLEETVAQRTAKLRETVAELEGFSYSIAHDMRAPLRSMSGYASILCTDYEAKLEPEARIFLQRIEASAERLDRLIQDVLNYSKIVRGEMDLEAVNFGKLAEDIVFSYSHLQEPHATITLEAPLGSVLANPAALTQVISNLLGNAVKFVAPGVKPRVVVWSEEKEHGFTRFWFVDNGIGIEPASQQRMFEIFQRLNHSDLYEGTGIGLSIVRKAAERMGGRVGLESTPGKGSRFWVELKRASSSPSG